MTEIRVSVHAGADPLGRCGWGVVYRRGVHTWVRGGGTSNANAPRTQVLALLLAIRYAPPTALVMRCPSRYVVDNLGRLDRWRASGRLLPGHPSAVRHADLWRQVDHLIRRRSLRVRAEYLPNHADADHKRARDLSRWYRQQQPVPARTSRRA